MTEITTFIIGAVVGLVGGILPTILSNHREEKCLRREKLEELYKDVTNWYNYVFFMVASFTPVLDKRYDWNKYYDQLSSYVESKGACIRSEIIISLYFPSMQEPFEVLKKSIQELASFIEKDLRHEYMLGHDISRYKGCFAKKFDACSEIYEKLTTFLKKEASKLG